MIQRDIFLFMRRLGLTTFLCGVLICLSAAGEVAPQRFSAGDRWCAIGDSITHSGDCYRLVHLYYLTRFPEQRFEWINCGAGGDTAAGTLRRLDWDILPHRPTVSIIMLGINDIWAEHGKLIGPDDYIRDVRALVGKLRAAGSRIILVTPSPYDGSAKHDGPQDPRRVGLERYVDQLRALAAEEKLPLVDFFGVMSDATAKLQSKDPAASLCSRDRVHPTPTGHAVMAYTFLKAQECPAVVSTLKVDAAGATSMQENCQVKDLRVSRDGLSCQVLENALPFPVDQLSKDAMELVPFSEALNREMLQVSGLTPGKYELRIDDARVGAWSEGELAAGVNLATIAETPQRQQAREIGELTARRHLTIAKKLRVITMYEHGEFKQHFSVDDVDSARNALEQRLAKIADPAERQRVRERFDRYFDAKPQQSKLQREVDGQLERLWEMNKPRWHKYELVKSKPE